MLARAALLLLAAALACRGKPPDTLARAGDLDDEGAGLLAQASLQLLTPEDEGVLGELARRRARARTGGAYGGDPYGGPGYGGTSYAGWTMPQWTYLTPNRTPTYQVTAGLTGAIEGVISWRGAPPVRLASRCGTIENPSLRLGAQRGVAGAIVYIAKVRVGRGLPYYVRPAGVGGTVTKRGCTLVPAAQVVAPLPAAIAIHGDTQRARVRVAGEGSSATQHELEEGGLVRTEIKPGVTRIDGDDGALAAAWVLGLETPYYAITDDAGRFRIDELAPGTYEVTIWQPPVAAIGRDGNWTYGAPIVVRRTVKVGTRAARLAVALSPR
jgi:hypothetical protein